MHAEPGNFGRMLSEILKLAPATKPFNEPLERILATTPRGKRTKGGSDLIRGPSSLGDAADALNLTREHVGNSLGRLRLQRQDAIGVAWHGPITQQRAMKRPFDVGVVHELSGRHELGPKCGGSKATTGGSIRQSNSGRGKGITLRYRSASHLWSPSMGWDLPRGLSIDHIVRRGCS